MDWLPPLMSTAKQAAACQVTFLLFLKGFDPPVGEGAPAEGPGGVGGEGGGPKNDSPYKQLESTEKSKIREKPKKTKSDL